MVHNSRRGRWTGRNCMAAWSLGNWTSFVHWKELSFTAAAPALPAYRNSYVKLNRL
jgi:hypothetical protein